MKKLYALALMTLFLAPTVYAQDLGSLQETIGVGKILSIGLSPSSTGNWYIVGNSDDSVASAVISGSNNVTITTQQTGADTVYVCTDQQGTNCQQITVTVVGSVLGASITVPHSAGSWVIQGKTVYYVSSQGLIPITTWSIFLSNGGKQKSIQPINDADMGLPLLSFMVAHDNRVQ